MAALLVVAAALMPSDADSPGAVIVRLLGAAILVTIVYSYLMSLRRS
jgi:hypothetical protein